MNLIEQVAELREPFAWQPIGVEGHYKIVSGIEKDETLDGMLDILSEIREGDASALEEIANLLEEAGYVAKAAYVRRYQAMAERMEAKSK